MERSEAVFAGENREEEVDALRFNLIGLRGTTDEEALADDDGDRPACRRLCATRRAKRTRRA